MNKEDIKTIAISVLVILLVIDLVVSWFMYVMLEDIKQKTIEQEGTINYLLEELDNSDKYLEYYRNNCILKEYYENETTCQQADS